MPNRILKESICTSDTIDKLNWFEEVLFYRLIVNCDDFGRFDGRVSIIKNRLFPLKDDLTLKTVKSAIQKLVSAGLAITYESMGKPYLYLPTWTVHQNVRAKKSKYPEPDDGKRASEYNCNHMIADVPVIQSNPIRESESESESNSDICVEPETASTPPVILLPLNDGTDYTVSEDQCREWVELYPAVDILQQLRNMKGWLVSNPAKRKTKTGICRFITNWLAKEQNRGGSVQRQVPQSGNVFMDMLREEEERGS